MYIWVLLATFITVLFSFNLSVRPDMKELYVDSQAATVASKLYVQHKAAEEYYKTAIKKFKKGLGASPNFMELDKDGTDGNNLVVAMTDYATVPNFHPAEGAHTILYCVNREGYDKPFFKNSSGTQCQQTEGNPLAGDINCCRGTGPDGKALKYLVTVVPIPVRWQARNAAGQPIKAPNTSMINALKEVTSDKLGFGYLVKDGGYYIRGVSDDTMQLYDAVGEDLMRYCGVEDSAGENKKAFCAIFAGSL